MATATDNPLVRNYLRRLELATARLPRRQANELLAQIKAHLEDSLGPSSTSEDTAKVIRGLGEPAELVAEQEAMLPAPNPGLRRATGRIRVVRLRTWIIAVIALAVIVPAAAIWIDMRTAPLLRSWGGSSWWYPQDGAAASSTSTFGDDATTISLTTQRQTGWVFDVYNPSRYTQTLVTADLNANLGGYGPGLEVTAASLPAPLEFTPFRSAAYSVHGSIPPHHWGAIRVLWTPDFCEAAGGSVGFSTVDLTVHVGWMDRTEQLAFPQVFALSFPRQYSPTGPGTGPCNVP